MKIKRILRHSVLLFLSAYLVGAGIRALDPTYILGEDHFVMYWFITTVLFYLYGFIIAYVYVFYFQARYLAETPKGKRFLTYLLLAYVGLPIFIFHSMIVYFFYRLDGRPFWSGSFVLGGDLVLALIISLYIVFLLHATHRSVYYTMITNFKSDFLQFVQDYPSEMPTQKSIAERVQDMETELLLGVVKNGRYAPALGVLVVTYGKLPRCYILGNKSVEIWSTSSGLSTLNVADWFMQIRNAFYINMWYFNLPEKGNVLIPKTPAVELEVQRIAQQMGMEVCDMLQISGNLKKDVVSRMQNITAFSTNWDDQYIDLKG